MALHCSAADLIVYFDEGQVRDLISDTGQRVSGDLTAHAGLTELLKSASGRLEGACFVSENYSADELANMSDNSKALAAEICATLTMAMLMRRRPGRFTAEATKAMVDEAEGYLQQLRDGHRLFDVGKHAEAGKPELSYPTVAQIHDANSITQRTKHFYPNPTRRLPISLGGG